MKRFFLSLIFALTLAGVADAQTTYTPNLHLAKPEAYQGSWAALMNTNFDTLDGLFPAGTTPVFGQTCAGTDRISGISAAGVITCSPTGSGSATLGVGLSAFDLQTSAANKIPYWTGVGTASTTDLSALGRTLLAGTTAAGMRSTLGAVIGTDVQAQNAKLADIATSSPADGAIFMWNGTNLITVTVSNCLDTAGQHLNFVLASHTFPCGTSGGGGGGLSGGTIGALLKYDTPTSAVPSAISEDFDSINLSKSLEACGGATCLFGLDTSIFATTLKTWAFPVNASDTFVGAIAPQALTNKTIVAGNNTISGITGSMMTSATVTPTQLSAPNKVRPCEIAFGDPGAASAVLVDDNDTPGVCSNDTGQTLTITAVKCYAPVGSPTVTPIITGGGGTSILTGALTCTSAAGGAAGTLSGTPTQTNGQTIDANITSAGGTAKYIVLRITYTL